MSPKTKLQTQVRGILQSSPRTKTTRNTYVLLSSPEWRSFDSLKFTWCDHPHVRLPFSNDRKSLGFKMFPDLKRETGRSFGERAKRNSLISPLFNLFNGMLTVRSMMIKQRFVRSMLAYSHCVSNYTSASFTMTLRLQRAMRG